MPVRRTMAYSIKKYMLGTDQIDADPNMPFRNRAISVAVTMMEVGFTVTYSERDNKVTLYRNEISTDSKYPSSSTNKLLSWKKL